MFKTIFTLAVIALVSNTDAVKITHKSSAVIKSRVNINGKLAQLKSRAMLKNKLKQEVVEEGEEDEDESEGEDYSDDELPTSISLKEAEYLISMVDIDGSGDVVVEEL